MRLHVCGRRLTHGLIAAAIDEKRAAFNLTSHGWSRTRSHVLGLEKFRIPVQIVAGIVVSFAFRKLLAGTLPKRVRGSASNNSLIKRSRMRRNLPYSWAIVTLVWLVFTAVKEGVNWAS
jgi:hypothetical protein